MSKTISAVMCEHGVIGGACSSNLEERLAATILSLESKLEKARAKIVGTRDIFHQYLGKTKEVRLLCLKLEKENRQIMAENQRLREAALSAIESKRGMGHLMPSSVGLAIDELEAALQEGK